MCEVKAFLLKNGQEELFFDNVDRIVFEGTEIHMSSIFGEEKRIKARPTLFNNTDGKIFFEIL